MWMRGKVIKKHKAGGRGRPEQGVVKAWRRGRGPHGKAMGGKRECDWPRQNEDSTGLRHQALLCHHCPSLGLSASSARAEKSLQ